jgi:hypothetical protein
MVESIHQLLVKQRIRHSGTTRAFRADDAQTGHELCRRHRVRLADHSGTDPCTVTREASEHMSGNGTPRESSAYRPSSIATHSEDTRVSHASCLYCGQCRDPRRELPETVRD